jgi:hypothetical protein
VDRSNALQDIYESPQSWEESLLAPLACREFERKMLLPTGLFFRRRVQAMSMELVVYTEQVAPQPVPQPAPPSKPIVLMDVIGVFYGGLVGRVYGHPKIQDGHRAWTSEIQGSYMLPWGEIVIETENTKYIAVNPYGEGWVMG